MKHYKVVVVAIALFFFCGCDNSGCGRSSDSAESSTESSEREKHESVKSRPSEPPRSKANHEDAIRPDEPADRGGNEKTPRTTDEKGESRGDKSHGDEKSKGSPNKKDSRGSGDGGSTGNDAGGNGEGRDHDGGKNSGRKGGYEPPADWLDSDVKNPPAVEKQHLWILLQEEICRLTFAKSMSFPPLGATGTSLEQIGEKFRFRGRCVIVDVNGDRRAYSFAGEMLGNKYHVTILNIKFSEPFDK